MKKYLLTFAMVICFMSNVPASCLGYGIYAYPSGNHIKQNSRIMLVGYSSDEIVIKKLNKKYLVYLEADGHKVALKVIETRKGMYLLTQAILKPAEKLMAGKTYTLKIERKKDKKNYAPIRWNIKTGRKEKAQWTATQGYDNSVPVWSKKPEFKKTSYIAYGCGPDIFAIFETGIKDASEVLVKTQLFDVTTGRVYTYYLQPDEKGVLEIGHSMCAGAFVFAKRHKYKVRFSLLDMTGNSNGKWTTWQKCKNPNKGSS